ncbi:MAG: hypothetical protein ACR2L2_09500 [Acidobacteriota bacterium]
MKRQHEIPVELESLVHLVAFDVLDGRVGAIDTAGAKYDPRNVLRK